MSTAGERIRKLRLEKDLTLDDVAKHLGVGRQAVHKYEQGTVTNIPLENLEKMADLFGVTPSYLAGWDVFLGEQSQSFDPSLLDALNERTGHKEDPSVTAVSTAMYELPEEQREQVSAMVLALVEKMKTQKKEG